MNQIYLPTTFPLQIQTIFSIKTVLKIIRIKLINHKRRKILEIFIENNLQIIQRKFKTFDSLAKKTEITGSFKRA